MGAPGADLLTPLRGLVVCTDDSLSACERVSFHHVVSPSSMISVHAEGRLWMIAVASLKLTVWPASLCTCVFSPLTSALPVPLRMTNFSLASIPVPHRPRSELRLRQLPAHLHISSPNNKFIPSTAYQHLRAFQSPRRRFRNKLRNPLLLASDLHHPPQAPP